MAPANITEFLSQKPSTKNGIFRHPAILFLAWLQIAQVAAAPGQGRVPQLSLNNLLKVDRMSLEPLTQQGTVCSALQLHSCDHGPAASNLDYV